MTSTALIVHLLDMARRLGEALAQGNAPADQLARLRALFDASYRGPEVAREAAWRVFLALLGLTTNLPALSGYDVREAASRALDREVEYDVVLAAHEECWTYYLRGRHSVRVSLALRGGRWSRLPGGEPCDPVEAVVESLEDLP